MTAYFLFSGCFSTSEVVAELQWTRYFSLVVTCDVCQEHEDRWCSYWSIQELGIPEDDLCYTTTVTQRTYHNVRRLMECLAELCSCKLVRGTRDCFSVLPFSSGPKAKDDLDCISLVHFFSPFSHLYSYNIIMTVNMIMEVIQFIRLFKCLTEIEDWKKTKQKTAQNSKRCNRSLKNPKNGAHKNGT